VIDGQQEDQVMSAVDDVIDMEQQQQQQSPQQQQQQQQDESEIDDVAEAVMSPVIVDPVDVAILKTPAGMIHYPCLLYVVVICCCFFVFFKKTMMCCVRIRIAFVVECDV